MTIPESVKSIGKDVFLDCKKLTIIFVKDSQAEKYAKGNGIKYQYMARIVTKDITKTYGDKPFLLNVKTSGGKLTYKVQNKKIVKINENGKVTIKGCGVTNIHIKSAKKGKCVSTTKTITLTVKPKQQKLMNLTSSNPGTLNVKWKKDAKAKGYIIEFTTDKKFKKNVKTIVVKKSSTVSKTIQKLKPGNTYLVRVCAYTLDKGEKIKGKYSTVKSVKVKE